MAASSSSGAAARGKSASTSVRPTAVSTANQRLSTQVTPNDVPSSVMMNNDLTVQQLNDMRESNLNSQHNRDLQKMDKAIQGDIATKQAEQAGQMAQVGESARLQQQIDAQNRAWQQSLLNESKPKITDMSQRSSGGVGGGQSMPGYYDDMSKVGQPRMPGDKYVPQSYITLEERMQKKQHEHEENMAGMNYAGIAAGINASKGGSLMDSAYKMQQLAIERDDAYTRRMAAFLPATRG